MNANRKKWIQALRSGEYKQVKGYLKTDKGYCCLGVACEVFNKENPGVLIETKEEFDKYSYFNGRYMDLPEVVQKWLGLSDCQGLVPNGQLNSSLISLNDNEGLTFSEIADVIEAEPRGLFIKGDKE